MGRGGLTMGREDFTTWTESSGENISETSTRATWTSLRRDDDDYLYKDFGVGNISTDFTYYMIFEMTALDAGDATSTIWLSMWCAQNVLEAGAPVTDPRIRFYINQIGTSNTTFQMRMAIDDGSGASTDISSTLDISTVYYLQITRSNSGNTLTMYIRTGSHTGSLVDTITATEAALTMTFRYMSTSRAMNVGSDVADNSSGYIEYLTDTLAWGHSFNGVDTPGEVNSVAGEDVDKVNSVQA